MPQRPMQMHTHRGRRGGVIQPPLTPPAPLRATLAFSLCPCAAALRGRPDRRVMGALPMSAGTGLAARGVPPAPDSGLRGSRGSWSLRLRGGAGLAMAHLSTFPRSPVSTPTRRRSISQVYIALPPCLGFLLRRGPEDVGLAGAQFPVLPRARASGETLIYVMRKKKKEP